ncbi:hypothetical protein [Thermus oshimai]|uniref:hypothetical protein n=1 Tax=Thermus oshimai TaxID=56957 RepID=UPI001181890A|nr:hypothetical protein [Thermus oshimai]
MEKRREESTIEGDANFKNPTNIPVLPGESKLLFELPIKIPTNAQDYVDNKRVLRIKVYYKYATQPKSEKSVVFLLKLSSVNSNIVREILLE